MQTKTLSLVALLASLAASTSGCSASASVDGGRDADDATATRIPDDASSSIDAGESAPIDGGPATVGTYDGPVADAACPKLPAAGQWQNISPPGSNYTQTYTGINAVVVRPDDPAVVYTGADSNGIFKSSDCGATWALVNTGTHAKDLSSGRPWSMAIDPVTPDVMYVVEGYGTSGLWKSTNAGVDWQQILTPNITSAFYSGGQITGLSVDPADHTHLVIESHGNCASGNLCSAESSDSGATWRLIEMPSVGAWAENSTVAILDRKTWLYCGLFSGLYRTADEGTSWQAMDAGSLPSCNYYEPYVWQAKDGRYYVPAIAYAGPGLLRSLPGDTSTWSIVANAPQDEVLIPTGVSLVAAKSDGTYSIASQSDPTTWKTFTGPAAGSAAVKGNLGGGAYFMAYDGTHHVLYASTFSTGLWQTVID
ncbi:MAG TPA: hypothetical protein VK762_10040 [Polyangiaceae bacterium]|jgi:hypothetical protein|nr:hypothetical protein [Polyangiaceae bacterium]